VTNIKTNAYAVMVFFIFTILGLPFLF